MLSGLKDMMLPGLSSAIWPMPDVVHGLCAKSPIVNTHNAGLRPSTCGF